ncbi:MAG: hypothetical protein V2A71_06790, partial [Candidatus Eisenbacteria bacterium]
EFMEGSEALTLEASVAERFRWVKQAVQKLEGRASEFQKYDAVSGCAHVFPDSQVMKFKAVFEHARANTKDGLRAVDAVIDFMGQSSGGGEKPVRTGAVLRCSKKPRDPVAYEKAKDDLERGRAYCFCPIIRRFLDGGMPHSFCYCGSGWYRRQWEGAIGKPLKRIEIVKSLLKGDDVCEFAIHLPDDV